MQASATIGRPRELSQPKVCCASRSAIAIVGGLVVSQLLTLYATPVVYLCLDRLSARRLSLRPCRVRPGHLG
ncbi:hypothetical protein RFM26_26740 [Mesorhizobium sp. VK23B]|uniref:Uncharacterized protein n=1 Tax=Mesorhizobium dulcispinae TaxID=3072316 RepID=A0ABU4XPM2_9HYPH|nr:MULTISPECIES: hypothetical protein [unclassified Mesorhizobium]MDX8469300.1 hypothetical protein [Mesorhizobium sp. VK23B]MDX8475567.1 hypothetical protein [Mesorhizobium sp. VK23A]